MFLESGSANFFLRRLGGGGSTAHHRNPKARHFCNRKRGILETFKNTLLVTVVQTTRTPIMEGGKSQPKCASSYMYAYGDYRELDGLLALDFASGHERLPKLFLAARDPIRK